ncbi:MAG: MFS transporter [Deltaproteobacteria bacterium HGW-Deltaproteobacteria-19]|jgi:POT family proton-dependent oligopeptide transporter|nr:MAG: MFS transporter [Deltaproteobacteria bacterium HGW-Deltaproteobacteria-19]
MPSPHDTLWGHPKGLYILFFTEMWERFSYFGMRALLIFYMTKQLMYSHGDASRIYGLYTGLVYFTPFFGGLLADRVLGQGRTLIIGAVLMAAGHFVMAFESLFYPALALLIVGSGAFKPNICTQVGSLYEPGDPRRDRAFSIFYVGVNLGAFLSPFVCGTLGEVYGWHYGFGAAGVGMVAGLFIYLWGRRWLAPDNLQRRAVPQEKSDPEVPVRGGGNARRVLGLVAVCLVVTLFWAAYEQQGNTIALWADADTDRHLFGWEVPATWFQSLNPLCIFLLTPLITTFWAWQARRGRELSTAAKMSVGCFLLGLSFLLLVPAAYAFDGDGVPVSMLWLVSFSVILTVGELYLSPVGLSLVTRMAPAGMISMMMGIWCLGQFAGNYLAGYLGYFWDLLPKEHFFLFIAAVAGTAGLIIMILLKPLKRIMES